MVQIFGDFWRVIASLFPALNIESTLLWLALIICAIADCLVTVRVCGFFIHGAGLPRTVLVRAVGTILNI